MLTTIHSFLTYPFFPSPKIQDSVFKNCSNLEDLKNLLTSQKDLDQWLCWKKEIKTFVHEHRTNLTEVDHFLKTITEWGMERNPQKTMALIVDIVSFELLDDVIRKREESSVVPYENIFDWAAENALLCPELEDDSLKTRVYSEWKKCRPIVLYVIPNLINIFLGAFNFLDAHKKFTTLWEKHLLLEIIYKFLVIPYCLIQVLQPAMVVTAKVYVVSALIIVSTGILISCYQRWFRPMPDEVVNCINLDKQFEMGVIEPKVGQAEELEQLIAALEVDANVLLIGDSGSGKTAIFHQFIQKKHKGELPEKLQKLKSFEVDCGLIVSSYNYGHSEIINQIKEQIEGYERNVLFFFDEFYPIATNVAAFQAFKKRFLEDKPHAKFVAAITPKQFLEIKKLDVDGSFRRRVVPIMIKSSGDEQNRLIIRAFIQRVAKDIPVTDEAVEAILEVSTKEDYFLGIGRPAKAIKILTDAIARCRMAYDPHYASTELSHAYQELEGLKLQANQNIKVNPETLQKILTVQKKINGLEIKLEQNKAQIVKIKKTLIEQRKLTEDYYHLTRLIASVADQIKVEKKQNILKAETKQTISNELIGQEAKMMYLWYHFYAIDAIKTILQLKINQVRKEMAVQVDNALIYQIYDEYKELAKTIEDDLYDDLEKEDKMKGSEFAKKEATNSNSLKKESFLSCNHSVIQDSEQDSNREEDQTWINQQRATNTAFTLSRRHTN